MKKNFWFYVCGVSLLLTLLVNLTGCAAKAQAADLMKGITPGAVTGKEMDDSFRMQEMSFALELLQASLKGEENKNILLSPLSVQLALAMTANGAAGQTRQEMEALLGGDIPLELLNEYLYTYVNDLPNKENSKLHIANSIWYRDEENRLQVEQGFLQTND